MKSAKVGNFTFINCVYFPLLHPHPPHPQALQQSSGGNIFTCVCMPVSQPPCLSVCLVSCTDLFVSCAPLNILTEAALMAMTHSIFVARCIWYDGHFRQLVNCPVLILLPAELLLTQKCMYEVTFFHCTFLFPRCFTCSCRSWRPVWSTTWT